MVYVHGTRWCIWCTRAIRLLERRGIPYQFIDVGGDREARAALRAKTGRTTVPQIWIGERWIGGCTDLEALDDRGELDHLTGEQVSR
ncbi:MAG TPA: glutaredoxin domain-containing protein [Kofleriaceae bacterium]|nr:glutaredoxin domain-containing protein [Kofleriaceae bacterium]